MPANEIGVERLGFSSNDGGTHLARSMMLKELTTLFNFITDPNATRDEYVYSIKEENCLGKRSGSARTLTARHLVALYSLDSSTTIFRALRYLWRRDTPGRPLLALLCAYARDAILRSSSEFIFSFREGDPVSRDALEAFLEGRFPDRFSPATKKSTAQNLNKTWTASGHLSGSRNKVRDKAVATAGATTYALFLDYLLGERGYSAFSGEYASLLDTSTPQAIMLAEEASRRGWMVFKHIGEVMEASFPAFITESEQEWIYEQS